MDRTFQRLVDRASPLGNNARKYLRTVERNGSRLLACLELSGRLSRVHFDRSAPALADDFDQVAAAGKDREETLLLLGTYYAVQRLCRAVLLAALSFAGTFYIVPETKQVIITMFGKPVGDPIVSPGLHLKIPVLQTANYFDKRFLEWDGDVAELPTKDKVFIEVDTYARWRISDALLFFQRLRIRKRET